jgi:phage gp29-like protein/2'-5' RNA ligase
MKYNAASRNVARLAAQQTESVAVVPAKASGAVSVVGPVDDMGRAMSPTGRPILGSMFTPRIIDRRSRITPPWTAEEIIAALAAAESGDMGPQADLSEAMQDRDAAYLGFRQTRILAPSKLPWSVEPADDSDLAKEIADFVRAEIKSIPNFPHAHRDMFSAIGSGVSALWIDWQEGGRSHGGEKPKSKYRIDGIHYINPKRYRFHWMEEKFLILPDWAMAFDKIADVRAMPFNELASAGFGIEPPPWKVIVHRSRLKSGHPAKAGLDRVCALHFYLRINALKDAAVYTEIFGMPFRVAKYPPGMLDEEKALLAEAMERLGTDAAAIVSNVVDIDWLESKSRTGGGTPYFELLKECERQMQLAWLGQDQTNTHNPTGGRTQVAEGGAPIRQDLVEADCIDAMTTDTMQLCKPIVGFSDYGWDLASTLCPLFKIRYEPEADYGSMSKVDEILFKLGFKQSQGQMAKRYNRDLPKSVDPEELMEPAQPAPMFGFGAGPGDKPGDPAIDGKTPPEAPAKKPVVPPAAKQAARVAAASGNFASETADSATDDYSYASTQVNITGSVRTQVMAMAADIPDDALVAEGREDDPHVTVKYGIDPAVTIEELRPIIGPRAAGSLTLGPTAFFAAPDWDVVFLTVDSPDIVALNKAIVDAVKTTSTKPNYVPHLTLAFVESGRGHEFAGNGALVGVKFNYNAVYYSDTEGNLTKIQAIRGHVRVTSPKPKLGETFYEPRFYKEGETVPDGWPDDYYAAAAKASYMTLSHMIAAEPDRDRRIAMERDREMMRRDCWAMSTAYEAAPVMATGQAAIDDLQVHAAERVASITASLAEQAREIVRTAPTLEAIPDLLRNAFAELDADKLQRLIGRSLFVARMNGRASMKRKPPKS